MKTYYYLVVILVVIGSAATPLLRAQAVATASIRCQVVDADSGQPLPARVYIQGEGGAWHFPVSQGGTAVQYRKSRPDNARSVEMHTTLSAHPLSVNLAPGKYTFTIERGKEYHPLHREITVGSQLVELQFPLRR